MQTNSSKKRWSTLRAYVDGEKLDMSTPEIERHRQM
jgi:hypothetical protein